MISEADIELVVSRFYARIRRDDLLGPVFAIRINADQWDRHEKHIVDFWSSIFLKTGRFKGNPMLKHLTLSGLTPTHFRRWLDLFSNTAEEALSEDKARAFGEMAERIAQSLQMGLAFHYDKMGEADHAFQEVSALRSRQR